MTARYHTIKRDSLPNHKMVHGSDLENGDGATSVI